MDDKLYKDLYELLRTGIEAALRTLEEYDTKYTRLVTMQKLTGLLGYADLSIKNGAVDEDTLFFASLTLCAMEL